MPFPNTPRVIYAQNPLDEVICQIRFPTILRIDAELPVAFQDSIRSVYPTFREKRGRQFDMPMPKEVARFLNAEKEGYEFVSEDALWMVSLTKDFLALSTKGYVRWEGFLDRWLLPFRKLIEIYHPAYCIRVGLRYKDVIRKSNLGLKNEPWATLLNSYIAGELSAPEIPSENIELASNELLINLGNKKGKVRIKHGLIIDEQNPGDGYLIDCDFFIESKTETNNVEETLAYFNRSAGNLFRWCISPRLHKAMVPNLI